MKKTLLIILFLRCITVAAQIRISDFKQSFTDGAAADIRTSVADPDGQLCAALKLETKLTGWTFDAGFDGIMDAKYGDGIIWLYVPASARKLTVAHSRYGVLRDWSFPVSLEPGRTYTMILSYERPRQKSPAQRPVIVSAPPAPTRIPSSFCNHFFDFYAGFNCSKYQDDYYEFDGETWFGLSYTWIGNRVGPYMSLALNTDACFSVLGGAAFRLTDPQTGSLDWQLYGGVGLIDGNIGFDIGTRFAWRSSRKLSRWDFGFGCQFSKDAVTPTVSVGFSIWGIPALVGIGLVAFAL